MGEFDISCHPYCTLLWGNISMQPANDIVAKLPQKSCSKPKAPLAGTMNMAKKIGHPKENTTMLYLESLAELMRLRAAVVEDTKLRLPAS